MKLEPVHSEGEPYPPARGQAQFAYPPTRETRRAIIGKAGMDRWQLVEAAS